MFKTLHHPISIALCLFVGLVVVADAVAQPGGGGPGTLPPDFRPPVVFDVGRSPYGVALGDLDGDGWRDVVVANEADFLNGNGGSISVLRNSTDWIADMPDEIPTRLEPEVRYGLPESLCGEDEYCGPREVAIGYMNDDYHLDVVVANAFAHSVAIFFNDPNNPGTLLQPPTFYNTDDGVFDTDLRGLVLVDVDLDTVLDIVVTGSKPSVTVTFDSNVVKVLHGPPGKWAPGVSPAALVNHDLGVQVNSAFDVAAGFFNEVKGDIDFVTCNNIDSSHSVLINQTGGNFSVSQRAGPRSEGIATGLFGTDAMTDFVSTDRDAEQVHVHLGDGQGAFSVQPPYAVGRAPFGVATGKLDLNPWPEVVTANQHGLNGNGIEVGTITVLVGKADGTFGGRYDFFLDPDPQVRHKPCQLALGDLNNDFTNDVVTANTHSGTVSVLINQYGMGGYP